MLNKNFSSKHDRKEAYIEISCFVMPMMKNIDFTLHQNAYTFESVTLNLATLINKLSQK